MADRILFVDDDVNILNGLKRNLRAYSDEWEFIFSSSGEDAWNTIESQKITCVVTDYRMEGINGVELLEKVTSGYPDIKRIILSGQADAGVFEQSQDVAQAYIPKPCNADDVMKTIISIMGGK
jgi:DNA-binding NtrC family response regulator